MCQLEVGLVMLLMLNLLVQDVQLLGRCVLLKELARHLPLRRQNNAILC
jgi:hypothetical protein